MACWVCGADYLRLILTQFGVEAGAGWSWAWQLPDSMKTILLCMYVSMRYKYIIVRLSRDTSTNTISKKRSFERHSCLNDSLVRYHHLQSKHRNQAHRGGTMGQISSFFVTWLNISISISKLFVLYKIKWSCPKSPNKLICCQSTNKIVGGARTTNQISFKANNEGKCRKKFDDWIKTLDRKKVL